MAKKSTKQQTAEEIARAAELARLAAEEAASEFEQRLAAGRAIDEEEGDLLSRGWHVARAGDVVRLATWDGRWATQLESSDAAHQGFEQLVAEHAEPATRGRGTRARR